MSKHTPGPWHLCHHLQSVENDRGCPCGYRGVIYGPESDVPMAVCQPGHDPEREGEEGLGPQRYPRDVEIANARLIAAAPDYHRQTDLNIGWLTLLLEAIEADDPKREILIRVNDLIRENKAVQAKAEGRSPTPATDRREG